MINGECCGRFAIELGGHVVGVGSFFNAGDVFDAKHTAVFRSSDDDVLEFLRSNQSSRGGDDIL